MNRVAPASTSAFAARPAARPVAALRRAVVLAAAPQGEKLMLDNLSPQEGSRRQHRRVARGHAGKGGGTGGRGERGQKSRSGASIRPGFEGGQMPLYRRLPKLKGIAGGMGAGQPDYVVLNVADLNALPEGTTVSLDTLKAARALNLSGKEDRLPLKVLGDGELSVSVNVHAQSFSASAKEAIEKAGGTAVVVPAKAKWVPARVAKQEKKAE